MDSGLIKKFERYSFSSARRLFVLEQMLSHLTDGTDDEFLNRCRAIADIDETILGYELDRRRPSPEDNAELSRLYSPPVSIPDLRRRAHHQFVDLIGFTITSLSPTEARDVLAPALRQLHRLQQFAFRCPHNADDHDPALSEPAPSQISSRRRQPGL